MLSHVVRVFSFTVMGVIAVDVLRLVVVTPSTVSVRVRLPAVAFGRQDSTVRSQLVMSYAAGTVTASTYCRPLLSCVVRVALWVARTTTPSELAWADSAGVSMMCTFWLLAFS